MFTILRSKNLLTWTYGWLSLSRPWGYRTFFMLNATEHDISIAHIKKVKKRKIKNFLAFKLYDVFYLLINVKMLTIVGILTIYEQDFHAQLR